MDAIRQLDQCSLTGSVQNCQAGAASRGEAHCCEGWCVAWNGSACIALPVEDRTWAAGLADRFESALQEALRSPGAEASLVIAERRAAVRQKTPGGGQ
jgi:hypothetical protein